MTDTITTSGVAVTAGGSSLTVAGTLRVASQTAYGAVLVTPSVRVAAQTVYAALLASPTTGTDGAASASAAASAVGAGLNVHGGAGTASASAAVSGHTTTVRQAMTGAATASVTAYGRGTASAAFGAGHAVAGASAAATSRAFGHSGVGHAAAAASAIATGRSLRQSTTGTAGGTAAALGHTRSFATFGAGHATAAAAAQAVGAGHHNAAPGTASAHAVAAAGGTYRAIQGAGTAAAHAIAAAGGARLTSYIAPGTASARAVALGGGYAIAGSFVSATVRDGVRFSAILGGTQGKANNLYSTAGFTDYFTVSMGYSITERVRFSARLSVTERAQIAIREQVGFKGTFIRLLMASLTEDIHLTTTMYARAMVSIIDGLKLTGVLAAQARYITTIHEALDFWAVLVRALGAHITEHVDLADLSVVKWLAMIGWADRVTLTGTMAPVWWLSGVAADTIEITLDDAVRAVFNNTVDDEITFGMGFFEPGGGISTWTMNTRTAAVTEWGNYPFNSFARLGPQQYIGASDDGLYELNGDDDDGDPIVAEIRSALLQLGQTHLSRIKAAYISARGNGRYLLKIITGVGEEYIYAADLQNMRASKVGLGKGLRARYFAFELVTTGQDFDLDTVEFVPVVMQRRV